MLLELNKYYLSLTNNSLAKTYPAHAGPKSLRAESARAVTLRKRKLGSYGKNWIFWPKTEILGPKKGVTFGD